MANVGTKPRPRTFLKPPVRSTLCLMTGGGKNLPIPDLRWREGWSPLPLLAALAAGGRVTLFFRSGLIFRVRVCLLWFLVEWWEWRLGK
jgi:hypothetical protein